jgi:hypothetical protein
MANGGARGKPASKAKSNEAKAEGRRKAGAGTGHRKRGSGEKQR